MLGGREAVAAAAKEPQAVRVYHCNFGAKLRPWAGRASRVPRTYETRTMHLEHSKGTAAPHELHLVWMHFHRRCLPYVREQLH